VISANNRDGGDEFAPLPSGAKGSSDRLVAHVYSELRILAESYLRRERPDHTLQPTALAHEAWIRISAQRNVEWKNRSHVLGVAAQAMRRILVDHARRHNAAKRDGGQCVTLDEGLLQHSATTLDVIAVHDALSRLTLLDARQSQIVELRFFGGLNVDETAQLLEISPATVKREWRSARAWLRRELSEGGQHQFTGD
jgi:RNA polymerase sigma factor (TIGR02999 family)